MFMNFKNKKMDKIIKIFSIATIFLTLSLCSAKLYSQQGWYNITSPTTNGLLGIYFRDVNNGLIGSYKTTNGGQSWIAMNGGGYLSFLDQNTGYAIYSGIYKTTNFGINWINQINPIPGAFYYGIYFPNTNIGYAVGIWGTIIKTTNGGTNWIVHNSPLWSDFSYSGIYFTDTLNGYIAGSNTFDTSVILKTTDGGNNWNIQYFSEYGLGLGPIFFTNSNTGYTGGSNYIYKTFNAGVTWTRYISPTSNGILSLYFSSSNTGYGACTNGDIIKTTNAGNNWFRQVTNTGNSLLTIYFVNDYVGYVCGDNGTVLKTTDGGGPPIGIKPISNEIPNVFSLSQNYPNPFNPSTKIKFSIPSNVRSEMSNVKLIIYDILGREIATLVNERLSPGTYEVQWSASSVATNFASGVYFYLIQAGDFQETKKMILIK